MHFPSNETIPTQETLLEMARAEGEQTKITEPIKQIASEVDPENKLHGEELVKEVCRYVRFILPRGTMLQDLYEADPSTRRDPRSRTAEELLSESNLLPHNKRIRNISGCIETAVVTRALLLAKGIPCVYTETLSSEWCEKHGPSYNPDSEDTPSMVGHVFIDFFDEALGEWFTADPNDPENTIHKYKDYTKEGQQFIYAKSAKDSWDLGYSKMKDFQRSVASFFHESQS